MTATTTPTRPNRAARRRALRPSPVITSGQLAAECGLTQHRIQTLVTEGLPAYSLTEKTYVFDRTEALEWLQDKGYLVDAYRLEIKRLVDAAPPLTAEQAAKIRAVLGGPA
jgi:hypothetical protein